MVPPSLPVNTQSVPISAVVTNFNGLHSLIPTLASLKAASYPFAEIIVVDDGSTDGSQDWVRQNCPDVKLVELGRNTARLNIVRNAGIKAATSRYVFLTDNDITVREGCVEQLLRTMQSDPDIFSVTPRLLDQDHPEIIYQSGNALHFLGVSVGSHRGKPVTALPWTTPIASIGGGIMLLDTEKLARIGYFDEGYALGWGDDGETHARAVVAGYKSLHDPMAICLVEVRPHGTSRAYGQYHNRLRFILAIYSRGSLIGLSPGLILFELMVISIAIGTRSFGAYRRAIATTWHERADIRRMRRMIQSLRRARDTGIMRSGTFEMPGLSKLPGPVQRIVAGIQSFTNIFWWAGYPFIG